MSLTSPTRFSEIFHVVVMNLNPSLHPHNCSLNLAHFFLNTSLEVCLEASLSSQAFSSFSFGDHFKLILDFVVQITEVILQSFRSICYPRAFLVVLLHAVSHDVIDIIIAPSLLRALPLQREAVFD